MLKLQTPFIFHPSDALHTSGQPSAQDIADLSKQGIVGVINLRPSAETPERDQRQEAQEAGLTYANIPISGPADLNAHNAQLLDEHIAKAQGPVLIYCGSSNRVGALLALRAKLIQGLSADEALKLGQSAGMTGLQAHISGLLRG